MGHTRFSIFCLIWIQLNMDYISKTIMSHRLGAFTLRYNSRHFDIPTVLIYYFLKYT